MKDDTQHSTLFKGEGYEITGSRATVTLTVPIISHQDTKTPRIDIIKPFVPSCLSGQDLETQPAPAPAANTPDDGIVRKRFRLISEAIITDTLFPFDLTLPGILKESLPLFQGIGLYKDHLKITDNNIGGVRNCAYNPETTPPGIDGDLCIDRQLDNLTAIRVEKGWVNRCSINCSFDWKPSHENMKPKAFLEAVYNGEIINGELARLIVTKVTGIAETSLVFFGADPTARALQYDPGEYKIRPYTGIITQNITPGLPGKEEIEMMTLEAALKKLEELTKERNTLKNQNQELERKLETQGLEYKAALEFQKKMQEDLRKEVTRLANIIGGGKMKTSHELVIAQADYTALQALEVEFKGEVEKMFPSLRCSKCGCTELERRSSVEIFPGPETQDKKQEFTTIH